MDTRSLPLSHVLRTLSLRRLSRQRCREWTQGFSRSALNRPDPRGTPSRCSGVPSAVGASATATARSTGYGIATYSDSFDDGFEELDTNASALDSIDDPQFNFEGPSEEMGELVGYLLDKGLGSVSRLADGGPSTSRPSPPLRSTVFIRTAASLQSPTGRLVLKKYTHAGPAGADSAGRASAERTKDSGGVVELFGLAQEQLVREPSLVLPGTLSLVLPLSQGDVLLGILVVEKAHPAQLTPWATGDRSSPTRALASPTATRQRAPGAPAGPGTSTPSTSTPSDASDPTSPFTFAERAELERLARALSNALWVDLRAALMYRGSKEQKRAMKGLVREAQGNLSTLRTLSLILAPRMDAADPADRDLTRGILAQGDRLHQLVAALEQAIYPAESTLPTFSLIKRASNATTSLAALPRPAQDAGSQQGMEVDFTRIVAEDSSKNSTRQTNNSN